MVSMIPRFFIAMLLLVQMASGQTFSNGSFETGDFTGWQLKGTPTVVSGPPTPTDGTFEALINSTGTTAPDNFAMSNSVPAATLNTFLNTTLPGNVKGAPVNGEAIQQTFSTPVGATITFSYAYASHEAPADSYDETGYVLNGVFHILADTNTPGQSMSNGTGFLTWGLPYRTMTISVGPGTNTLGFVTYNTGNTSAPSGLYLDNIVVTPIAPVAATINPSGSMSSQATGISGTNVVGSFADANSIQHGFLYNGTTTNAFDPSGSIATLSTGVSGSNVVGWYNDGSGVQHGFFYDGTNFSTLDPSGTIGTVATGVSGSNVAGYYTDGGGVQHGFFYNGTTYTSLDPSGSILTQPNGVSGANVGGYYQDTNHTAHGFFYDGTNFTVVDPSGTTSTVVTGISGTSVVGWYDDASAVQHGFLFDGTTYTVIDPPGSTDTFATGISGSYVVGWYKDAGGVQHGFFYDGAGYTTVDPTGSTDTQITAVSGTSFAGWYADSSQVQHAFVGSFSETGATVTLDNFYQVYDGSPVTDTATTNPANLNVAYTYNGDATAPTDAGTYTVVAMVNDPTYQGTASATLTITPAPASVVLSNLTQTYDGTPKPASATTTPAGLNVTFTYEDSNNNISATPPTAAGTYTVTGTVSDPNYSAGSDTETLTVSPAPASVVLSNLAQTYDGAPEPASATTTPAGLNVTFTYTDINHNVSATPPTAAGTYTVTGTVSDPNYSAGSDTETLTISPASAGVALINLIQTYDGAPESASANTTPAGLNVIFTYEDSSNNISATPPTAAGNYTVTGTINDPNYQGNNSAPFVIGKATVAVALSNLSQTYDGTPESAMASTTPTGLNVTFTYEDSSNNISATPPTVAGTYTVTGTINDPNYQGNNSAPFVIGKATATVALSSLNQTYDGTPKSATASTTPTGLNVTFTYEDSSNNTSATPPTVAGNYTVTGTVNDANYQGTNSAPFVIGKATATVALSNLNQAYDGTPKSVSATTTPNGLNVTFTYKDSSNNVSASPPTAAGTYTATGTISDANYQGNDSEMLTITQANASVVLSNLNQTYDGTPKSVSASTTPIGLNVTFTYKDSSNNVSGTPPTTAGTYTVTGMINDPNYSGQSSGILTIAQATASVALSDLNQTYDGTSKSAMATTTPTGLNVTFTYTDINNSVSATPPTAAGTYTVTGTINDTNYQGNNSAPFVIGKATATVTLTDLNQTYDGTPKSASATTTPNGLNVTFTYEDSGNNISATPPTLAGTYTVTGTINDSNYQGMASGMFVIAKSTMTFSQWETSLSFTGGPSDTPENDGVPNLLKYLYDINPTASMSVADRAALPSMSLTSVDGIDYLTLTYRQFMFETGLTIQVQTSTDLQTWTTVSPPELSQQIGTDSVTGDPIMQVGVIANGGRQFIRLNVISP